MNNQRLIRMAMMMMLRPVINLFVGADDNDKSPEGRARQQQARDLNKRTKQAMRVTRRIGKF